MVEPPDTFVPVQWDALSVCVCVCTPQPGMSLTTGLTSSSPAAVTAPLPRSGSGGVICVTPRCPSLIPYLILSGNGIQKAVYSFSPLPPPHPPQPPTPPPPPSVAPSLLSSHHSPSFIHAIQSGDFCLSVLKQDKKKQKTIQIDFSLVGEGGSHLLCMGMVRIRMHQSNTHRASLAYRFS